MNSSIVIPFMEHLCCSECHGELDLSGQDLVCKKCGGRYPATNGVPLFSVEYIASKGRGASMEKERRLRMGKAMPLLKKIYRLITPPAFHFLQRGEDKLALYMDEVRRSSDKPFIVDIGAGSKRWGDVMSVDIFNYPGIDYCAYAEKLPFKDNSVDMVVSSSAIEHFKSMRNAYGEFERVVKPGGIIFISAPFIYPFHAEPSDYHRWSANGLIDDFSRFESIESGGYAGPHSAMHAVLSAYLAWMFSFGSHTIYMMWNLIFGWLLFPLQIADRLRGQYRKSTPVDALAYFVGRKKQS